jgi:hypothetical protein
MRKIILELPDDIYGFEPKMWDKFTEAMQMALNRMAVGYMKYHHNLNELFMDCEEDKIAFIRQRLSMYSGSINNDVCDCRETNLAVTKTKHSPSCFLVLHKKKLNSGNTENLLDVANGCFCEFIRPNYKGAKIHFRAQDSTESPGLVRD